MPPPNAKIAKRIARFLKDADDVQLETKRQTHNGKDETVLVVTMTMSREKFLKNKPLSVDTPGTYQSRVLTYDGEDITPAIDKLFEGPKWAVKQRYPASLGPMAHRLDLHEALKDEGLVASAPRKQKATKPARCRKCKSTYDEDGLCRCAEPVEIPEDLFEL